MKIGAIFHAEVTEELEYVVVVQERKERLAQGSLGGVNRRGQNLIVRLDR